VAFKEPSRLLLQGPPGVQEREPSRLLTFDDVADLLAVNVEVVRWLVGEKRLKTLRIGTELRVRPEALRAFLDASEE